ncbi:MAG: helix-turn-helix transcriptional regulator [Pseudomonadota bacterium]
MKTDRRQRAQTFRERLSQAMNQTGTTQSGLARHAGVDRSTISQLLRPGTRLPNAHVVAECAAALGVSADWLIGLSDLPENATDLLAAQVLVTEAQRSPLDDQIARWHREAAGYKIRHVPARLADVLKTPDMLAWEYAPHLARSTTQAIESAQDRLTWMRETRTDYEIAMPLFEVDSLASATGYYVDLPKDVRAGQLAHLARLYDQLYPALRVVLFDARRVLSAPITVFGPRIGVIYLGEHFMAFRDHDRVSTLTRQFDTLVREAYVSDRGFSNYVRRRAGEAGLDL